MAPYKDPSKEDKDKYFLQNHSSGDFDFERHPIVKPASTLSATVILFIIAAVALLLFTRFDYSQGLISYYDEAEDFSRVLPLSLTEKIAEASTTLAFKPDHGQYLQPLYKLLIAKPDNDTLHYYLGVCHFKQKDHINAIRSFRKVLRYSTSAFKQKAEYRLGLALWQGKNIEQARTVFKKIIKQPRHIYREKASQILEEKDFS